MKDEQDYWMLVGRIVATIIAVILGVVIMSSCSTQKRAFRKVAWANYRHPEVVQAFCNKSTLKEYLPGDTLWYPGEQLPCPEETKDTAGKAKDGQFSNTKQKGVKTKSGETVQCPPSFSVVDTFKWRDDDELNAKIQELTLCTEAKNKVEGAKKTLTNILIISGILNLVLACLLGLLLRRKLSPSGWLKKLTKNN